MKQDAIIEITGSDVETVTETKGIYGEKDGRHYLFYDDETGKNRITITPQRVVIHRENQPCTDMIIEPGREMLFTVRTVMGTLEMATYGKHIGIQLSDSEKRFELIYEIMVDGSAEDTRTVSIRVKLM